MLTEYKCISCNQMFEATQDKKICLECMNSENKMFTVIRDYLYEHHGASPNEVVQATGISISMIMRFLKQGRLETTGNIKLVKCDECGKSIDYGRLCNACEMAKNHQLSSSSGKKNVKSSNTMYTRQKK